MVGFLTVSWIYSCVAPEIIPALVFPGGLTGGLAVAIDSPPRRTTPDDTTGHEGRCPPPTDLRHQPHPSENSWLASSPETERAHRRSAAAEMSGSSRRSSAPPLGATGHDPNQ